MLYIGGLAELVRLVRPLDQGIDFDFDFDFDSFVHAGRGEAVCARVRHASLTGADLTELCSVRGGFVSNSCCYTHRFYKKSYTILCPSGCFSVAVCMFLLTLE